MNIIEQDLISKISSAQLSERFKQDGYVVVENAIPREIVNQMRLTFDELMEQKIQRSKIAPARQKDQRQISNEGVKIDFRPEGGNHDFNRWNMHLPSQQEFINDITLSNPLVLSIIKSVMGSDPVAFLIASDTPYPGSGFQNIHQDFPRFGITVNVPLVDFTEENAPLEVWPTSHVRSNKFNTESVNLSADEIKNLVQRVPGKRLLIKAGSIVIRDQRLVHRGTANTGNKSRPCLSIWYKNVEQFDLLGLTIPTPHRSVANICARLGQAIRSNARGSTGRIKNQSLLNWGNFFGRIVEECSASDRDYRRVIPEQIWNKLSLDSKHLLRFASVENQKNSNRSLFGSALLLGAAGIFGLVAAALTTRSIFKGRN